LAGAATEQGLAAGADGTDTGAVVLFNRNMQNKSGSLNMHMYVSSIHCDYI